MKTNAGFDIIFEHSTTKTDGTEGIALGQRDTQFGREYVTWHFIDWPEGRSYFWGHYFMNKDNARTDFNDRVLKLLDRR